MNFADIDIGYVISRSHSFTSQDVRIFSEISGDINPIHLDNEYASKTKFKKPIVHGLLSASLISAVLGNDLCGPGVIYLSQTLKFLKPVFPGDSLHTKATVIEKLSTKNQLKILTEIYDSEAELVITGEALVKVP
jgi:3-hydroxybutyryl-CoA dehydratase